MAVKKRPSTARARKAIAVEVVPVAAPEAPAAVLATDTELAFLALYAEDAYCMAPGVNPPPDPRLMPRWRVLGTLTAVDAPLRIGRHKVCAREAFYGWLLTNGSERVLAIRGTEGYREWLIDGLFAPRSAHPVAGRVESGFWDVFASMRIDGKTLSSIAKDGPITVVGHSLGAALATYACLELTRAGAKVRGVFIASPRPGDAAFSKAFGEAVPDHVMYRNAADIVPTVPRWFGYADVPNVKTLSAKETGITITGGYAGQHHVLSYVALMNRAALKNLKPITCDQRFVDCIRV